MIGAVLECCAGIDVGKKFVVVCVMTGPADGEPHQQTRKYGTINGDLEKLRDWLKSCGCSHVVMESTGAYWKPILNVLEEVEGMQVVLANSQQVKNLRGQFQSPSQRLRRLLRTATKYLMIAGADEARAGRSTSRVLAVQSGGVAPGAIICALQVHFGRGYAV